MKLLFLTTVNPCDRTTGSEIATDNIVTALKRNGCEVTCLFYSRVGGSSEYFENKSISERQIESSDNLLKPLIWFSYSLFKCTPYSASKYFSNNYKKRVNELIKQNNYDAVVIDHAQMGWVLDFIPADIKVLFVAHNVENYIYTELSNSASLIGSYVYKRESKLIAALEQKLTMRSAQTLVLTDKDKEYFDNYSPNSSVLTMPFIVDSDKVKVVKVKSGLLRIIGTWSWSSNRKGLIWFLDQVLPHLNGEITIEVAGKGADDLFSKDYPQVNYKGFVDSSTTFLEEATVVAIPSTEGSGLQIKTLEAMLYCRTIVATEFATRGISDIGDDLHIENIPIKFANKINELILANITVNKAVNNVRADKFLKQIDKVLQKI